MHAIDQMSGGVRIKSNREMMVELPETGTPRRRRAVIYRDRTPHYVPDLFDA